MKRMILVFMAFLVMGFAFGQSYASDEARKAEMADIAAAVLAADKAGTVAFSGNVYTGLQGDFAKGMGKVYAWEDANGTPIWANFRMDYSLDKNVGMTMNFRTKGTDALSAAQGNRFYPFLNRGFVWAKTADSMFKVRSGYLWDSDFESSFNAWDTASNYEWVAELTAFPLPNLELGFTLPTPIAKTNASNVFKDATYGLVYSPPGLRVSMMGEIGSVDANRAVNFGVDYTAMKNVLLRLEGDLQQIGIADVGYYELMPEIAYTMGAFTPDLQVYAFLYKDSTPNLFKLYPNLTYTAGKAQYFAGLYVNFNSREGFKASPYQQLELNVNYAMNKKSHIKPGVYVTKASGVDLLFQPYVEFFAAF